VQNRGVLTALRAAAIVIVATGLNDVIAGAAPRYEPLYAYLAAIALVVLLDGLILGLLAAALAIGFYALLFLPRATLLRDLQFPLIATAGTIVVAAAVRATVLRSRRRAQPVEIYATTAPPLLPPPPPPLDNTEVLHAIDDLRDELRAALTEISSAREREEMLERTFLEAREALVTRLRIAEEEAKAKDAELRRQLDAERGAFEVARTEALSLAAEEATLAARIRLLEDTLEEEKRRTQSHERRIATLNGDAEQLNVALEAEHSRALRLSAEIATERERLADAQTERARERANVETARSEIEKLQRMLTAERVAATTRSGEFEAEQSARANAEQELAALREENYADKSARAEADRELASLREQLEVGASAVTKTREEFEREVATLRSALEAEGSVRADAERELASLREHRDESAQTIASTRAETSELRLALDAATTARVDVERELASLREHRDESARTIATTRDETGELRLALDAATTARTDVERELASLLEQREQETTDLRTALDIEKAAREESERALKTASDEIEHERGEAIARATDLATLRRDLELGRAHAEGEKTLRERAEQDVAAARADVALLETSLGELDALRATSETDLRAQFDTKINTIVTHLAHDHEADLGKAVLEREEARAEARSATAKLGKVQARIEEERQAVLAKLREADERHKIAIGDATQLLAETRVAAQKEIERLQLRIAELQHTQAPAQPQPSRGRILIAHPDPDMRATARASLERAGYEIVSAADGLEALRTAIAQNPDVVIADAVMPKMNGRELCQLLKSQEKTAHIRVILLTRASDDMPKGDIPPDLLLRKPVPLETLKSTLAQMVTRA
jgi:CheY-like chemotaxis protein/chromosome segregation ATPase